ncbi:MAG: cation transporter [Chlorobiales bacterium]|nr:cation transporter [Chlorobiales bacterium]
MSLENRPSLKRYAWLSIAAAITTIVLKASAYYLTGSVGLLSDAIESFVNLVGALMALAMLTVAEHPADEDHPYGHTKAEYFSSVVEGLLILVAAVSIGYTAIERIITPKPLEQLGLGLGISVVASLVNLGVGLVLLRAGRQYYSITLEADAHHLLTDVWTSAGVLVGVGAVAIFDLNILDPIAALVVAANIVWTGVQIVRRSVSGLMDSALPKDERKAIRDVLDSYSQKGIKYHALRTRQSGVRRFVSVHILVPGNWSVARGHRLLEQIETEICRAVPHVNVITHLEPLEDPESLNDLDLDRKGISQEKEKTKIEKIKE